MCWPLVVGSMPRDGLSLPQFTPVTQEARMTTTGLNIPNLEIVPNTDEIASCNVCGQTNYVWPKGEVAKTIGERTTRRWSLRLFRNASGKLVTVYVTTEGVVMPYEKKRLNGNKILHYTVYSGMKYSQARKRLLADSGLKDKLVEAN